jgi:exosortase
MDGPSSPSASPGWRWTRLPSSLALFALVALMLALYAETAGRLVRQWWLDSNHSHGFLVPLFSGFLIWQRLGTLRTLQPRGSWVGLFVLLAGLSGLVLGDLGVVISVLGNSLIVAVSGLVLFHLGWTALRLLAFPLAYLSFMVPVPDSLLDTVALPLQAFAAWTAATVLDGMGVPVLLQGNVIHLSRSSFGVTEACSGLRSLVSLFAVAVAWAHLSSLGRWSAPALVASTVPIAIVANAGRVVVTALVGESFGVEYARGFLHSVSGWVVFAVAFLLLAGVHHALGLAWRLRDRRHV